MNHLLFIGVGQIVIIALVVLLLFGGTKIPELMKGLGKGYKIFARRGRQHRKEHQITSILTQIKLETMAKEMSRRTFLKQGAAAAIGLAVVPSTVLGKKFGYTAPSDKLNILGVGIGGRGASVLKGLESQNIIGLCDVDWKYADHIFKRYPAAKKYNDYRKMYDEMLKSADAVMVATADHTHAIIAADAITAGKHVYCEKPLTHTVYESRLLTKLADKYKVATQMGNQGASAEGVRKACEWIWNGEIGEVRRVDTFTDRPIWPQGLARPEEDMRIPKTMNWDAFIGPAPYRPYNAAYTPWNFRGWWDFGTGERAIWPAISCTPCSRG